MNLKMNGLANLDGLLGNDLRQAQINILLDQALADDIEVTDIRNPETGKLMSGIGKGKLSWNPKDSKWILNYDLYSLSEDEDLLPFIKRFYALFKAIEFYPAIENDLIESFLEQIPEDRKIRFLQIMLADLEGTINDRISGANKTEAKGRITEAFGKVIDQYWGGGDTDKITDLTHDRFAQTMELEPIGYAAQ